MLSPPYSPHADLNEELSVVRPSEKTAASSIAKLLPATSRPTPKNSVLASSQSSSADESESTDNDSDLEDEDSSGTVPSDEIPSSFPRKRSSSNAFYEDDEDDEEADDSMLDSRSTTSTGSTVSSGYPSARSPSPRSCPRWVSPPTGTHERRMTTCWDALKSNPAKLLRLERSMLEMYPLRRHSWAGPGTSSFGSEDGDLSSMSSSAIAASAAAAAAKTGPGRGRGRRAHRSSSTVPSSGSSTSQGRGRRRVSPAAESSAAASPDSDDVSGQRTGSASSGVRVHDLSLSQIKDYSPPVSTLPPGKSLRAEWKGAPMDLSNDPELSLLHPAEAHLASVLRLPCDVYLDSKRRLFAEKVHRLKQGLPFRRTDSQKACRIDVNKASRLFGAFEKIGWLEDSLFTQFLE